MTSDRAAHANWQNARASTGPRTSAGKARSGQNARKHGLSTTDSDPQAAEHTGRLVAALLGGASVGSTLREAAHAVAEAHLHLRRVLACKRAAVQTSALGSVNDDPDAHAPVPVEAMPDLLRALEGLERYERRAFSRRAAAIRRFRALVGRDAPPPLIDAPTSARISVPTSDESDRLMS